MGGCCSGDSEREGLDPSGRPLRPAKKEYDSDDSSDEPQGLLSDDEPGSPRSGDESASSNEAEKRLEKAVSDHADHAPALTNSHSTRNAINRNVIEGWKSAVSAGNDSLVIHLYEEYKDYDVIGLGFDNGDNSLHVACQQKKIQMAYFLLTKGVEVNTVNSKNGNTALHYACHERDEQMVKLLLKNGADPRVKNGKGKKPIDIARRYRSIKIQHLLRNAEEEYTLNLAFKNEKKGKAGTQGGNPEDLGLDDAENFGAASDGQRPKRPIARPTVLKGKKIGVYTGGVLEDMNNNTDIGDSDYESGGYSAGRNRFDSNASSRAGGAGGGGSSTDEGGAEYEDSSESDRPQTKEEKANQETQLMLHTIKQRNPFVKRKLERRQTKKILESGKGAPEVNRKQSVVDNKILAAKRAKLPELEGWLEKRKPRPPYQWQKRWVIVRDTHILWSDKQRDIDDPSKQEQRKEFNGFLNINVLQEVVKYDSKSQNKFIIKARDAKRSQSREYLWKCPSMEDRNYWVKGLRQYMKYHEEAYQFGIV